MSKKNVVKKKKNVEMAKNYYEREIIHFFISVRQNTGVALCSAKTGDPANSKWKLCKNNLCTNCYKIYMADISK